MSAAAAPWLVGQRIQAQYRQLVLELRRNGVQVVERAYHAGWFDSTAVTDLTLPLDGLPCLRLRAETRIQHISPQWRTAFDERSVLTLARTRLTRPEPDAAGPASAASLVTQVVWGGEAWSRLLLAPEGKPVGEVRVRPEQGRIQVSLTLPQWSLSDSKGTLLRLEGLDLESSTRRGAAGLRLGAMELHLAGAELKSPWRERAVMIQGLRLSSAATAPQGRVKVRTEWSMEAAQSGAARVEDLKLHLLLEGISAPLLARTAQALPTFLVRSPPPGGRGLALATSLLANVGNLLQSRPRLSLQQLHLSTADGDLDGRFEMRFSGPPPRQSLDPIRWLERLELDARLAVAEPLGRRLLAAVEADQSVSVPVSGGGAAAEDGLESWVRQGLLVRRDQHLHLRLLLRGGLLSVNDRQIPLFY